MSFVKPVKTGLEEKHQNSINYIQIYFPVKKTIIRGIYFPREPIPREWLILLYSWGNILLEGKSLILFRRNYYEKKIVPCESTSEEVSWSKSQNIVMRLHLKVGAENLRSITNLAIKLTSISISNKAVPNISSSVPMKVETTLFQNIGQES